MSLLDRAIAAVSPQRGLSRAVARTRIRMLRAYEAGRHSERDAGWITPSSGPNESVGPFLTRVRDRARALVRDTPYAGRIVTVQAAHQVGYGITPRVDTGSPALDRQVTDLWNEFVAASDVTGVQDLHGQLNLAARTRAQDGEALVRFVRPSAQRMRTLGLPVPLQIEVLEPDWIDDLKDGGGGSQGPLTVRGIEIDAWGRRTAIWLLREHPGERLTATAARESQRIPIGDVMHLFRVLRPGQHRGISDLAPIIKRMHRLDAYEEAALEKARIEACLTAFVISDAAPAVGPLGTAPATAADGEQNVVFGAGMVNYLRPGEKVETVVPTGAGGFEAFATHTLMAISIGAGVTYDQATGDLRQANFSSLRAGKIEFKRQILQDQWLMFVPRLCVPIWREFVRAAQLVGRLPQGDIRVEWAPPPFEMIDPHREIAAILLKVRAGLLPPQQAIAELGEDWRSVVESYATWNDAIDDRGLIFDSDPRRTGRGGGAQDASQNAAIEIAATGAASIAGND